MEDPPGDEVLEALATVVKLFDTIRDRVEAVDRRARELRAGRAHGASYAALLAGASGPLVVEVISELLDGLFETGSRLRRAEARALHDEGLSMDKIALLLRVSRQRVSAIINSPIATGDAESHQDRHRSMGLSLTAPEFHMIAESLPHIVWVAGPDGTTEYVNRRGTDYTGESREAYHGVNRWSVVHPDDQEVAQRAWARAVRTQTAYDLDYRLRRSDGQFRWHRFRSLPVRGTDGAVIKWIGTATDIDDQKRLEMDLRRAEQQASQALALLEAL
jgi:PAS domain S-box-containing protein